MQTYPTTLRPYLAAVAIGGTAWSLGLGENAIFLGAFLALMISLLGEDVGKVVLAVDRLRELEELKTDLDPQAIRFAIDDMKDDVRSLEHQFVPGPLDE